MKRDKRIHEVPEILDVIERLCKLVEEVGNQTHGYSHPTDCFCSRGGFWRDGLIDPEYWRHDPETSIAFIERATRQALAVPEVLGLA